MAENTKIEWADHSWSPWRGCTKVSPGCQNCYAEALSRRNPAVLGEWGKGAPRVEAKNWNDPVKWNRNAVDGKRPRVFPSLCDWLDEEVPVVWLGRFLHLISETPNLDWLLLTKRPELFDRRMAQLATSDTPWASLGRRWWNGQFPLNVGFGVSAEDQHRADIRVKYLLNIPAAMRWVSAEPLLGPVSFTKAVTGRGVEDIDWIVIGGESGRNARPCSVDWIRAIVAECKAADVPVFVKQIGSHPIMLNREIWERHGSPREWSPGSGYGRPKIQDPKGGEMWEWPRDIQIRNFYDISLRPTPGA